MKKQLAKFFCENCGAEVAENARFCRSCGKFFTSVRCPACGMTGSSSMFNNGCPACGYAVNRTGRGAAAPLRESDARRLSGREKKRIRAAFAGHREASGRANADAPLPAWIYVITAVALAGMLAAVWGILSGGF